MWLMLQQSEPDDYVISSGSNYSVRQFVEKAFDCGGITIQWKGSGEDEVGACSKTGDVLVKVNPKFYRPAEVESLLGDYSKAKRKLGWKPKVKFDELVKMMVEDDLERP